MVSRVTASNNVWNPWRELARFQNEVGRMLNEPTRPHVGSDTPAFNIYRNEHGSLVTAELPGLNAGSLEITVNGDTITIQGKRDAEQQADGARIQRRERVTGEFKRTLKFPYRVNAANTDAIYQRGVLFVTVPAVEDEKPHQVTIKSA